ncbi:GntR family transcriptional regulator/MocR family aminotransferase [Sphingomonas sp. SORGH_AS870]|uniref:MocR-like pyridoxine biosynthesis transcription factor PdxR n=1 Tax=Sphingomonas sp. SORGH_AS_0870 TaxID=3041801 RepID=UPI00285C6769|nr:PLP-dependent aminotransferase family protein [Sphingomonas sp. SORGH_AS_0870]MDR6145867.1 GntR family transcriptional regulator/MocR family aminotransferase [Sphingomonas sp. SORGH_AS_0870]
MAATHPATWILIDRRAGYLERQIHDAIRDRVLAGQLVAGERLPSSRALAAMLGVARSTVVAGYELLRAEGFVTGRAGSAMRVADLPPAPDGARAAPLPRLSPPEPEPERFLPFRPGLPDLDSFPHEVWSRCLSARARHLHIHDLGYRDENGLPALRQAIVDHVTRARAVLADPEQVIIMPSTAAILALLARVLLPAPGRTVWLEEPGYRTAHDIFVAAGAAIVPRPCDAEGMTIGHNDPAPSIIYVTPSHQYPTGVAMSLTRRIALLHFAAAQDAVIIEDDYDSEFHYASRPLAALQGIDRADRVAYVGTFSKVLAPGLRIAYAVLPAWLLAQVRPILRREGGSVPIHVQAAMADFLNAGHLRAHVRTMQRVYAERMTALCDALATVAGDMLCVEPAAGGLQLPVWFRDQRIDDRKVAHALQNRGIGAMPLSPFHAAMPRNGLLFGIGGATDRNIARLSNVIERNWPFYRISTS